MATEQERNELIMRWRYQCELLAQYTTAGNAPLIDATRQRINSIAQSAEAAKVLLPAPASMTKAALAANDPVYEALEGLFDPAAPATAPYSAPTPDLAPVGPGAAAQQAPKRARAKKAATTPGQQHAAAIAPPAAAAAPQPVLAQPAPGADLMHQCADGCGTLIPSRLTFAQGHASKYHSLIRQVETGALPYNQLPALMQQECIFNQQPEGSKEPLQCVNARLEIRRNVGGGKPPARGGSICPTPVSAPGTSGVTAPNPPAPAVNAAAPALATNPTQTIAERLAYHQGEIAKLTPVHEAMQKEVAQLHQKYEKLLKAGGVAAPKRRRNRKPRNQPATQASAAPLNAAPSVS